MVNSKVSKYIVLVFSMFLLSCGTYKDIPYFQDLKLTEPVSESITNFSSIKIQKDDVLGIHVSSLNPEAASVFNSKLTRQNGNNEDYSVANPINPFEGYLVGESGEIQMPVLGSVKVLGLTTTELRNNIQKQLEKYLKQPSVNVRIVNFKVSVLGDVVRPDVYSVKNERITILEALSLAGDLNITAKRKNVLLIREQDSKRQYIPIDLNSKALFTSDYYYLKSNDVLYVQAGKTKYAPHDIAFRNATLIVSALSVVAIALSTVYR